MNSTCFNVVIEDNIAQLILNRPEKRNSMIPEFWDELPQIIRKIDRCNEARALARNLANYPVSASKNEPESAWATQNRARAAQVELENA